MPDSEAGNGTFDEPASSSRSLEAAIRRLDPAYFGLVMSTGIVSIAFHDLGRSAIAVVLAVFNVACFAVLLALFAVRIALYPANLYADLWDSGRRWGTLTFVVGTNTVGAQFIVFFEWPLAATALWLLTTVLTPVLLYYLFVTAFVGRWDSSIDDRVSGALLLSVVCMQSLAILGGLLSDVWVAYSGVLVITSVAYWAGGFVLYLIVITIVTYRLMAYPLDPIDWHGPFWITMGAAAITTLAGATLGPRLQTIPAWEPYAPMTLSVTFLAWAIATWWIPILLVLDAWKFTAVELDGQAPIWVTLFPWARLGFGDRLHFYEPASWGRVFPMGMYTACTVNLAGVGTFATLAVIPTYWGWFALVVWALTILGTARAAGRMLSGLRPAADAAESP